MNDNINLAAGVFFVGVVGLFMFSLYRTKRYEREARGDQKPKRDKHYFPTFKAAYEWFVQFWNWAWSDRKRILIVLVALIWFLFVWPTPYRYFKSGSTNYRVNRFTGNTEHLTGSGWR